MYHIQLKIIKHAEKLENRAHQEEERQSTENDQELTKILELLERSIKKVIKIIFCKVKI